MSNPNNKSSITVCVCVCLAIVEISEVLLVCGGGWWSESGRESGNAEPRNQRRGVCYACVCVCQVMQAKPTGHTHTRNARIQVSWVKESGREPVSPARESGSECERASWLQTHYTLRVWARGSRGVKWSGVEESDCWRVRVVHTHAHTRAYSNVGARRHIECSFEASLGDRATEQQNDRAIG